MKRIFIFALPDYFSLLHFNLHWAKLFAFLYIIQFLSSNVNLLIFSAEFRVDKINGSIPFANDTKLI